MSDFFLFQIGRLRYYAVTPQPHMPLWCVYAVYEGTTEVWGSWLMTFEEVEVLVDAA